MPEQVFVWSTVYPEYAQRMRVMRAAVYSAYALADELTLEPMEKPQGSRTLPINAVQWHGTNKRGNQ